MRAPISVVVELVEGCTMGCAQCGVQGIREPGVGGWQWMHQDTLWRVAQQMMSFRSTTGINFSGHGEPTMHPEWERMVLWLGATLRKVRWRNFTRPTITLTTSGQGLVSGDWPEKRIVELMTHSVDTLVVGTYQTNRHETTRLLDMVPHLRATVPGLEVGAYPGSPQMDPLARIHPYHPRIVLMGPRSLVDLRSRWSLDNQGGQLPERPDARLLGDTCHLPWTEMHVRCDGSVALCTNDWLGEYVLGSVHEETITEIWDGDRMRAARALLWHEGRRGLSPCSRCSRRFSMGRRFLEPPDDLTDRHREQAAAAMAGPPLTGRALRL